METKRLWYKPGCVGRAPLPACGIQSISFLRDDRGYLDHSGFPSLRFMAAFSFWLCLGARMCLFPIIVPLYSMCDCILITSVKHHSDGLVVSLSHVQTIWYQCRELFAWYLTQSCLAFDLNLIHAGRSRTNFRFHFVWSFTSQLFNLTCTACLWPQHGDTQVASEGRLLALLHQHSAGNYGKRHGCRGKEAFASSLLLKETIQCQNGSGCVSSSWSFSGVVVVFFSLACIKGKDVMSTPLCTQ